MLHVLLITSLMRLTPSAPGQGAVLTGRVTSDSLGGRPIPNAEIAIPALGERTSADSSGFFRLIGLAPGPQVVVVRAARLLPAEDTVILIDGREVTRNFALSPSPQVLDPIIAHGDYDTTGMRSFQIWRGSESAGRGGQFVGPMELHARDDWALPDIIGALQKVRIIQYNGMKFLTLGLGARAVDPKSNASDRILDLPRAIPADSSSPIGCWAEVYVDRRKFYEPSSGRDAPDLNRFRGSDLNAIELWLGPAESRMEFGTWHSSCGTLVLWTTAKGRWPGRE